MARKPQPRISKVFTYPRYFLRREALQHALGLSGSQLDAMERRGEFPQRVRLSDRTVGWVCAEVDAWVSARIAARHGVLPEPPRPSDIAEILRQEAA